MRKESFRSALALIAIGGISLAGPVSAEGMLDIYLGGAFTEHSDFDIDTSAFGSLSAPATWSDSFAVGLRGGYWLEAFGNWLGFAGDVSYFAPEISKFFGVSVPESTFHTAAITPLVMLRVPLLTVEEGGNPRLQPYFGIGPGLFTSIFEVDGVDGVEAGFAVGLDLRVGVAGLVTRHFGLFIEYRRTQFDMNIEDDFGDELDTKIKSNHVNGGVALRF